MDKKCQLENKREVIVQFVEGGKSDEATTKLPLFTQCLLCQTMKMYDQIKSYFAI